MSDPAASLPSKEHFEAELNSEFDLPLRDGKVVKATLYSVRTHVNDDRIENFSLDFRAPPETVADQQMYSLGHERLGSMDLFLVPVKRDAEGLYFEAVFSRMK